MTWVHCQDVRSTAKLFDGRRRLKRLQEVDPFCIASLTEDILLGYLAEDCFKLRLEMRIRCPDNEAVTFVTPRMTQIRQRTVSCEVRVVKALPNAKSG